MTAHARTPGLGDGEGENIVDCVSMSGGVDDPRSSRSLDSARFRAAIALSSSNSLPADVATFEIDTFLECILAFVLPEKSRHEM